MTRLAQTQPRDLCPHLAAAALWMTKKPLSTRRGKARKLYARGFVPAVDDLLAL
jgi:hypothetical protein